MSRKPGSRSTAGSAVAGVCALTIAWLFAPLLASAETYRLPLLPSASDALREGVVRIVNHSDEPGVVAVTAIDDSGLAFGPVTLALAAGETLQFSSTDLERGNGALGMPTGIGGGQGDWRLVLDTLLDIEPLAYARTEAGFVDSLHDVVPRRSFYHRVTLLAPGNGLPDGSALRLINPTDAAAQVAIFGVDDANALAPGQVSMALAAGAARTVSARALENGAAGLTGRLGGGDGDWQLLIFTGAAIEAMTVLDTASGPLANLSAGQAEEGSVLLFLPAGEAMHEGRLRITNRSEAGTVRIFAVDDAGQSFGPVSLRMAGNRTVTLSSNDLENGNAAKRLPASLGSGEGNWRLVLVSELDLDVFAYLSGSIPRELGSLINLQALDLSGNRLSGFIPPELANPGFLRRLSLQSNALTGTVPLALWERSMHRDLRVRFDGNALHGFERPPEDGPAPTWPGGAADNGNASHHSVAWYQGPLVWEWDWRGSPVEHLRPVLGRWAALAVRIDHEVPEPPPAVTRVLDSEGNVLAESLEQAAPPATGSAGSGRWRTAGLAELSGNVAVSTISDPDVVAHEFGHNLGLRHTPGCGAANTDAGYPYGNGELGPDAGWDVNWRRFVAGGRVPHHSSRGQIEEVSRGSRHDVDHLDPPVRRHRQASASARRRPAGSRAPGTALSWHCRKQDPKRRTPPPCPHSA